MTQTPPPAPGWYQDPSGAVSSPWDGRNWGLAAPPPAAGGLPKKKQSIPKWVIVFAVIAVLMVIGEAGLHRNNGSSTSTSSSTARSATNAAAPPLVGIGREVRDGKFAFVATSVDRAKTAGDPRNRVETVTAQGEFVNVHLSVSNVGDQAQDFFASNQKLQIGDKQFSANGTAAMWIGSMTVKISPGNSIQAVVSFDVAPGTPTTGCSRCATRASPVAQRSVCSSPAVGPTRETSGYPKGRQARRSCGEWSAPPKLILVVGRDKASPQFLEPAGVICIRMGRCRISRV